MELGKIYEHLKQGTFNTIYSLSNQKIWKLKNCITTAQ